MAKKLLPDGLIHPGVAGSYNLDEEKLKEFPPSSIMMRDALFELIRDNVSFNFEVEYKQKPREDGPGPVTGVLKWTPNGIESAT